MPEPTKSGLSDNAAGALAYFTVIPAIIFLIAEPYKTNPYVRFHAWQSVFLNISLFVFSIINVIPILGWIVFLLGFVVLFIVWLITVIKASKGERFKLPVIGNLAEKQASA